MVSRNYIFSGGSGQERLPETSHPDADYLIILRHQAEVEVEVEVEDCTRRLCVRQPCPPPPRARPPLW